MVNPISTTSSYEEQADIIRHTEATKFTVADTIGGGVGILITHYIFQYMAQYEGFYHWTLYALAAHYGRIATYYFIQSKSLTLSTKQWGHLLAALSIPCGASWGGLTLYLTNDITYIFITVCLLFAIVGGAIGATGHNFPVFTAFVLPIFIPFIIFFIHLGQELFYGMAVITTSYMLVSLYISYRFSQSKQHEIILSLKNKDLLSELEEKKNIAEQANADKSRFLAAASHDLRQPLQTMNLFAEALSQRIDNVEQQDLLRKLRVSMQDTGDLLNTLLDISKLDAGLIHVQRSHFLLFPLLQKITKNMAEQANKNITISLDNKLQVKNSTEQTDINHIIVDSDMVLLQNVIRNLLSNAVKFTPKGEIKVSCMKTQYGYTLCIQDTGIGIAPDEQKKVFNAFYQASNNKRDRSKGIGLGLSIVDHLCRLLEHPLTMRSELGKGTCFEIALPLAQYLSPSKIVAKNVNHIDATVLVVDDDTAILDGMSAMLEPWGCNVLIASSMNEAVEVVLQQQSIDLILADYRLEEIITGDLVVKKVREILNNPSIPAIIISGDTEPKRMQEIAAKGFEALYKPIKPAQLRALMNHFLDKNHISTEG